MPPSSVSAKPQVVEQASSLIEKALLKFMVLQVELATSDLKVDASAANAMADFVQNATAKRVMKRLKEYKRPLSNARADLGVAVHIRDYLNVMGDSKLPEVELFPHAIKEAALTDAHHTEISDEQLVQKWSNFCKNSRNLCLLVRAYSVMDHEFLTMLDKIVQVVAGEMDTGESGEFNPANVDIQQIMMSLLLRGDLNFAQMASSMKRITDRDPDMMRDCMGIVMTILKEAGIETPDLGALQASALLPTQSAPTTALAPVPSAFSRLFENLAKIDKSA
jgi:hypothetical protein